MSIEICIICDDCSCIILAASSVTEARREGRRDKTVFTANKKDLCADCHGRRERNSQQAVATSSTEATNSDL